MATTHQDTRVMDNTQHQTLANTQQQSLNNQHNPALDSKHNKTLDSETDGPVYVKPEHIHDSDNTSLESGTPFDQATTKKLLRKLDWHLVPFLALLYLYVSFRDHSTIVQC